MSCPFSLPVPISITVNTSGSVPEPLSNTHSLSSSHGGFTRISEFTFSPLLTAEVLGTEYSMNDLLPNKVSNTTAVWDFGDGFSLSATETLTASHTYKVPGIYTISVFFYDQNGNPYLNTLTETLSVYNYIETSVTLDKKDFIIDATNTIYNVPSFPASEKKTFTINVQTSWQDIPTDGNFTLYMTSSGSNSKPFDTTNKYAHIMPFNAFYDKNGEIINNNAGLDINTNLSEKKYAIEPATNKIWQIDTDLLSVDTLKQYNINVFTLGYSTQNLGLQNEKLAGFYNSTTSRFLSSDKNTSSPVTFSYVDDSPNLEGVRLLVKIDTSNHKLKKFYVDGLEDDINLTYKNYMQGPGILVSNGPGILVRILKPNPDFNNLFSFTSTGVPEMSSINYKRQGDPFQVFIALQDQNKNILKSYNKFIKKTNNDDDYSFVVNWVSGNTTLTSNISSISTVHFPYNTTTNNSELSSFLYLNITPPSTGTWTLNVTARVDSLTASYGEKNYNNYVVLNNAGEECFTGSKTFTVLPSTNETELYKINEDIDYADILKGYRFQSFLHQYNDLFDGLFTSFVGQASSRPTTFGKTVFEKIANFAENHSDIDVCNISQLQSFYDLLNEDVDILLPQAPAELKRLYDLLSIKLSKLIGDYTKEQKLQTNYSTTSAESRNVDFENPIDPTTYTVTAGTKFIARQKFNGDIIVINPQKVASSTLTPESSDATPLLDYSYQDRGSFTIESTPGAAQTTLEDIAWFDKSEVLYGTASVKLAGASTDGDSTADEFGWLTLGTTSDYTYLHGTGDYTIEFNAKSDSNSGTILAFQNTENDYANLTSGWKGVQIRIQGGGPSGSGHMRILIFDGTTAERLTVNMSPSIDISQWRKYAISRSGTTLYFFVDGQLIGTKTQSVNTTGDSSHVPRIADDDHEPSQYGGYGLTWFDQYRITTDARYTANYTTVNGTWPTNANDDSFYNNTDLVLIMDGTYANTQSNQTIKSQYSLNDYNYVSTWGWPLDTTVSRGSGLKTLYDFYPYVSYNETVASQNIQNNVIDYNNVYNDVTRSVSTENSWNSAGGVIYKNIDYQIRKGLNI